MHPFLERYCAGIPDTAPPLVMEKLIDVGVLGSTPKSGAQASAMLTTGVHPLAASVKYHGGLTAPNVQRCKIWLAEQLRWRWNGDPTLKSGPAPYATYPDGTLIVNNAGDFITIDKIDAQHADIDLHLVIAAAGRTTLALGMAHNIVEELDNQGVFDANNFELNTRYHTNPLRMLRSWYLAHPGDPKTLRRAGNICTRLAQMMGNVGDAPHLTLNTKAKADHKECDVSRWMTVRAAQAADEWEAALGRLSPVAEAVRTQARKCLLYSEEHPAVTQPFTALADWEGPSPQFPDGKVNYEPHSAMTRWGLLARATMDPEGTRAWYEAMDWTRPSDPNFANDHNFGITVKLAGRYGWRS